MSTAYELLEAGSAGAHNFVGTTQAFLVFVSLSSKFVWNFTGYFQIYAVKKFEHCRNSLCIIFTLRLD